MSTWGRCNPELEPDTNAPQLERVGGPKGYARWPVAIGALLVIALVGLLWAKPWQGPSPQIVAADPSVFATATPGPPATSTPKLTSTPSRSAAPPTKGPSPTSRPTINPVTAAFNRRQCQSTSLWRMVSSEVTATRLTRTMYAVEPADATGPTDDAIPMSRLYANSLRAVGLCVPWTPVMSPVDELLHVVLWQVNDAGEAREIYAPVIIDIPLFDLGEAYYAPPVGEDPLWPAGRYVFEIKRIAGGGGSRWMGIEFIPTVAPAAIALR